MVASSLQSDLLARCRHVISRYFPDSSTATIVPQGASGGFSGAGIYRLGLGGREYCVRCWPASAPDPQRLKGLHRLLEHTAVLGVTQVAVPLKSNDGSTLVGQDGHWWQVEPWMPGLADYHQRPSRARLQEAMGVLARWHIAARQFVPNADERPWFASVGAATSPGLMERVNAIQHWRTVGEHTILPLLKTYPDQEARQLLSQVWMHFQALAPVIEKRLARLLPSQVPLQPCLRDIWHDHLLFTADRLTGLIDPSACRMENVTTDLARLLGSLVEDDRGEWDFALDCYQATRTLSLTELQLLTAFDESGVLLSGITWLDWLLVQRRQFEKGELVRARIDAVLRRLKRLRDTNLECSDLS